MPSVESVLPLSTEANTQILFPSSKLLNSNFNSDEMLFLKFTCTEWFNLATTSKTNRHTENPNNIYAGMDPAIATIMIPAPKQIQSSTNIRYIDDTNAVQGMINTASSVGGFITDLALTFIPFVGPALGIGSFLGGMARDITTGRKDLDATQSVFESAEKRVYNISFTLTATSQQEGQDIARIVNIFHALALPKKSGAVSLNVGAPYADKAYPPPLWRFGIGKSVDGFVDPSWLGQTSYTVLKSVNINTAAAGSPYMIKKGDDDVKPLMVSFSLVFVDYEPMYRSDTSYQIIPRSADILEQ